MESEKKIENKKIKQSRQTVPKSEREDTDMSIRSIFRADKNSRMVFEKLADHNSLLRRCDKVSLAWSIVTAKQLGLDIDPIKATGQAYILPYKSRFGTYVAQLQVGYKGLIKIAYDSGHFKLIKVIDVKEGEEKRIAEFMKSDQDDIDLSLEALEKGRISGYEERRQKKTIGYFAYAKLKNEVKVFKFMSLSECKDWAKKYSDTYKRNGKYTIDNDKMYSKTVLKNLLRSETIPPASSLSILQSRDADTDVNVYELKNK